MDYVRWPGVGINPDNSLNWPAILFFLHNKIENLHTMCDSTAFS